MGILDSIKQVISGEQTNTSEQNKSAPEAAEPSPSFYVDTIEVNRVEKDRFFRTSPYSPLEDRINFSGLDYYPPNPAYRFSLPLQQAEQPEELSLQTSTGDEQPFVRIGTVEFEVEGQPARLAVYQSAHHDDLFMPFRDATSGRETYGAGRYLEPVELAGDKLLVDFNLAYNPYCAYSENYSCPLPPVENHLKVPIRAGE
ncbi:MAG TPA: DUF1684 domain-containing protein, partial [Anaerolineae bacterium]